MYPSNENPMYGVFVKNMVDGLIKEGATISGQAIISKRPKGAIQYFISYCSYFMQGIFGVFKEFDLIYCHYVLHNAPLALFMKLISRKPLVVNIHGTDMLGQGRAVLLLGPFRKLLLKSATLIVVPSHFMKQRTIEITGLSKDKFFISPSGGINFPDSIALPKNSSRDFIIGYVGRITANKGIFILLEALNSLMNSEAASNWKLIVAGGGPDEDAFLDKIKEYGLEDKIIWKGILPQQELTKIFDQMTILIFPTLLEESLGLVGLEAMAHGVPVIGSKIGGLQNYIIDQKNGFLYEAGNIDTLSDILKALSLNPDRITNMKIQARITAKAYETTKITRELRQKLQTLI